MAVARHQGTSNSVGFRLCNVLLTEEQQIDNDANDIMRLMAKAIEDTSPNPRSPWNRRIVLGCWAVRASCGLCCSRSL